MISVICCYKCNSIRGGNLTGKSFSKNVGSAILVEIMYVEGRLYFDDIHQGCFRSSLFVTKSSDQLAILASCCAFLPWLVSRVEQSLKQNQFKVTKCRAPKTCLRKLRGDSGFFTRYNEWNVQTSDWLPFGQSFTCDRKQNYIYHFHVHVGW